MGAVFGALLVGVSTLFTKQHYVLDVAAGVLLASLAYVVFLRGCRREQVPDLDQQAAPVMVACAAGMVGVATAATWTAYRLSLG
jgi:membrane-associated phospholipid phosphatase